MVRRASGGGWRGEAGRGGGGGGVGGGGAPGPVALGRAGPRAKSNSLGINPTSLGLNLTMFLHRGLDLPQ